MRRKGQRLGGAGLALAITLLVGCAGTRRVADEASDRTSSVLATVDTSGLAAGATHGTIDGASSTPAAEVEALIGSWISVEASGEGLPPGTVFEIAFTADKVSIVQPCAVDHPYTVSTTPAPVGVDNAGVLSLSDGAFSYFCLDAQPDESSPSTDAMSWLFRLFGPTGEFTRTGDRLVFSSTDGDRLVLESGQPTDNATPVTGLGGRWAAARSYPSDSWAPHNTSSPEMPSSPALSFDPDAPPPMPPEPDTQRIRFDGETMTVETGCGTADTLFGVTDGVLHVASESFAASTETSCASSLFSAGVFTLVMRGPIVTVSGDELTLELPDGSMGLTLYRVAAVPDPALEAHGWQLTGYQRDGETAAVVPPGTPATISISDGLLVLDAGCNYAGGFVFVEAGTIRAVDGIATTLIGCSEPAATLESVLNTAFSAPATYSIDGDSLTVSGAGTRLTFTAAA